MGENSMTKFTNLLVLVGLILFFVSGCAKPDLTATRQLAFEAYQAGDYTAAADKFQVLVTEIPKDADLWFRLGNSYAKSKAPQKAINAYENALLRDPKMAKAWYNMGLIYLQESLKSFVDMDSYVPADDPVAIQGKHMREGIFSLLENPGEKHDTQD